MLTSFDNIESYIEQNRKLDLAMDLILTFGLRRGQTSSDADKKTEATEPKWQTCNEHLKILTFFLALLEDPPALLDEDDTWSAGKDSGTGCNVGVLMMLEAVVKTGPEDMSSCNYTLYRNSLLAEGRLLQNQLGTRLTFHPSE